MSERTKTRLTEIYVFSGTACRKYELPRKQTQALLKTLSGNRVKRVVPKTRGISAIPSMNKGFARRGYGACALAAARFNAGMTQAFLADATGIRQPHVSAMECGKRSIGEVAAKRLGLALQCDWQDLVRL